ncbi:MAG: FG-GAP-like repeat-containing protein, partial [Cuspidothrix sp.]
MNTKLAIDLLTQSQNNLTKSLAALGLLTNGTIITSLQAKIDQGITNAANKYKQLNNQVDTVNANLQLANEELTLVTSHKNIEQERLLELKKQQSELNNSLKNLSTKKELINKNSDGQKAEIKTQIDTLKNNITKTETEITQIKQQIQDGLGLVANYNQLTQQYNTAQNQANYHNQYVQRWGVVGQERGKSGKTKDIWGWITDTEQVKLRDGYQQQANQLKQKVNGLQTQFDSFNKNLSVLQATRESKTNQLWLYYHDLEAKKTLLSLNNTEFSKDLALIELQISQAKTDLQQLEKTEIPTQEKTVQATTQRVNDAQAVADKLKTDKTSAQQNLNDFVKDNQDLLGTDVSLDLLQDLITKTTAKITILQAQLAKSNQSADTLKGLKQDISIQQEKLEQLKQHYQLLALQELDVTQQRLQSFNSQLAAENAVNNAIKVNTIQSYADLLPQLIEQAKALSDIWVENLKTNHKLTVDISDLFQNNLISFNQLADYIEKNLATPDINYSLNQIQLDEAIAIQDTQVKYRDALTKTVDDLGEAIELQKKSVQQGEEIAGKLQHLQNLTQYEKEYATNKNNTALNVKLINELSQEVSNKIADIPNQLDLPNDKQEQLIETNLQKYIQQKQNDILATQNISFDDVKTKIYGVDTFNPAKLTYDGFGTNHTWANQNSYPRFLADVNGDGKADIVGFASGGVWTALAKGDGTFNPAKFAYDGFGINHTWANQDGVPRFLADVNGDGKADIVGFASGGVWPALAKGDGTFNPAIFVYQGFGINQTWTSQNAVPRFLADVNGDGFSDIVGFASNGVIVALSNVAKKQQEQIDSLKKANQQKGIADLQTLRLETAHLTLQSEQNSDKVQSYLQDSLNIFNVREKRLTSSTKPLPSIDGTFDVKSAFTPPSYQVSNNNFNYQTGDFNGDGKTDLIHFVNIGNGYVHVWNSKGDGTFDVKAAFTPAAGYNVSNNNFNFKTGDFNGDGKTDLIHFVNNGGKGYVHVWLSKGDGTFDVKSPFTPNPDYNVSNNNFNFKTGDFDGDGKTDLIHLVSSGNGYVHLWNSKGDGTFDISPAFVPNPSYQVNNNNFNFRLGDFNGDGKNDLTHLVNSGNGYVHVWTSNGDSEATIKKEAQDGLQANRDKYFPELNQATTLANLQTQITKEIDQSQQQIAQLKASITQKQAQAAAALSQAAWYEQEAATNWQLSRKSGPTWTEERQVKARSGKNKTITVTHVDHNWIIWDTYTQQAASLREQAANLFKGIETNTNQQNTTSDILKQWQNASSIADQTALTQAQLTTLLNQLDAKRQLNGDKQQQIADWEKLLATLQPQLQKAIKDAETAKNNVTKEWTEYTKSKQEYQTALNDVLIRRTDLQVQGQQLLREMNDVKDWVTQQSTLLNDEITQADALITQLKTQRDAITKQLTTASGNAQTNLLTQQALLNQSIDLLTQKQVVLIAQQTTFVQKQTLLNTQKQVIDTQYQLLDAYLENPDKDTSSLEKLLTDTRATLAEVQKLAEQAEASSNALTALMDDVQASLLLQNDKYLSAIKDKQQILEDILAITELKENNTLKATQKQLELNTLSPQVNDILKKATDAGSQEAAKLLQAVRNNDMAATYEIIYRDYQDLASDKGGWCVKGIARPEDRQIAANAYNKMLEYRQLKAEAEKQAAQFTQLRTLAESQLNLLKQQETLAAKELADLKLSIGNNQEQINAKQEELAIAQFRVDALSQLRNWTEQTQTQLLSVEKLNLSQAKLEQDLANNRQYLIDDAVKAQLNKQRLEIERDRQIAVAKLEQLNQLKTEESLQTAINKLRLDIG